MHLPRPFHRLHAFPVALLLGALLHVDAHAQFSRVYRAHPTTADREMTHALRATDDGGAILAGHISVEANSNLLNAFVMKTGPGGELEWTWEFRVQFRSQQFNDVIQTSDGGYIAVGWTGTFQVDDLFLVRFDDQGDTLWTRRIGGAGSDQARGVREREDGSFLIWGYTGSVSTDLHSQASITHVSAQGDALGTTVFGGDDQSQFQFADVRADGSMVLVGYTDAVTPGNAMHVTALAPDGSVDWTRKFEAWGLSPTSLHTLANGDILITGFKNIQGGSSAVGVSVAMRLGPDGQVAWAKTYGGGDDSFGDAFEQNDGQLLVTGSVRTLNAAVNGHLVQLDPDGAVLGSATVQLYSLNQVNETLARVVRAADGTFLAAGANYGAWLYNFLELPDGGCDLVPQPCPVAELDLEVTDVPMSFTAGLLPASTIVQEVHTTATTIAACTVGITEPNAQPPLRAYPTPTNGMLTLEGDARTQIMSAALRDVRGALHWAGALHPGTQVINLRPLSPGVYFLHYGTEQGPGVLRILRQ